MTLHEKHTTPDSPDTDSSPSTLWIRVPEAAKRLGIGEKAVRSACDLGQIKHRWFGKHLRILASGLEEVPPVRPRHRRKLR
jgi:hypothetical protein